VFSVAACRPQSLFSHPDDHRLEFIFGGRLGRQPLQILGVPRDGSRGDVVKVLAFTNELLEFRQQAIPPDKGSNTREFEDFARN
jgi:hypothetical protein